MLYYGIMRGAGAAAETVEGGERAVQQERQDIDLERRYDGLYEQYGVPLEQDHAGEYLAVSPRGEILLGATFSEVAHEATRKFGPGNFLFKVGERAVGRWR
ncbi:MAG: hypothetical protein M3O34_15680 [Chloroflexota bacterium]|nr:hypothetical protein [Chloroflexota bacterium]